MEPLQEALRCNSREKTHKILPLPAVISNFTKHIGGIHVLDSFLASIRFDMRTSNGRKGSVPWALLAPNKILNDCKKGLDLIG